MILTTLGVFHLPKNFGKFLSGIQFGKSAFHLSQVPVRGSRGRPGSLIDREKYGTGDKNNTDQKSVNGTQIFHWEVSTGKTGLPFQEFRLLRKISRGTNENIVFHLHPNRNFRNFLVNGKRSLSHARIYSSQKQNIVIPEMTSEAN